MRTAAHRRPAPPGAAILAALACSACSLLHPGPAQPTASQPSATTPSRSASPAPAAIPPAAPAPPATVAAAPAKKPPAAKPATRSATPAAPKASPPAATPPAAVAKAAPPLDLKSLEQHLKETPAIGVMTKLSLKNQVDDLLDRFRDYYAGRLNTTLAELRRPFDLLVMKVLSLLQDSDPALAKAILDSREAIWAILSNRERFAQYA